MRSLLRQLRRRSLLRWGASLSLLALLPMAVQAGGDGTIGSLPSGDGGDGGQHFYFAGSRAELPGAIVNAWGDGYYVLVDLPGEDIWLEFYGNVTLVLDEQYLAAHPGLQLGVASGFNGGGMLARAEVGGVLTDRKWFVEPGFTLSTPYDGFLSPALQQGLKLYTLQVGTARRGSMSYSSFGGLITIEQAFK